MQVDGPTLRDFIAAHGPLPADGLAELAVRLAVGLATLHGSGLSHGDLGPSRVVLAEDGPRLTGVGMARVASGAADLGPAGDMGWFGALLVFAATGRSPSAAEDTGSLLGVLRELARMCMSADPAARPTAVQARDRLQNPSAPAVPSTPVPVPPAQISPAQISPAPIPRAPIARAPVAPAPPAAIPVPVRDPVEVSVAGRVATPVSGAVLAPTLPGVVLGSGVAASRPGPPRPVAQHLAPMPRVSGPVVVPPAVGRRRPPWAALVAVGVVGAAVVVAVVLLVAGRSDPVGTGPAAAAPTSSAPSPPRADPAADARLVDAASDPRFGTDAAQFVTPSGNIACAMSAEVRCDVAARTWDLPPTPPDCELAFGTGAVLAGTEVGELSCVGDTVAQAGLEVLGYGEAVERDGVVCVSRETGLRCESRGTGHGFTVSRARYELF